MTQIPNCPQFDAHARPNASTSWLLLASVLASLLPPTLDAQSVPAKSTPSPAAAVRRSWSSMADRGLLSMTTSYPACCPLSAQSG